MILLTPASVVYFCQFILTVLVAVYLLWRSFQPVENRLQMRLAAGVFAVTTLLLASLWVEVTSLGPWRDYARFFIGLVLTVQGIFVFLFLYHVPEWDPRDKREVWVVMAFLVLVRLPFEIYVFFQRFQDFAATGIASRSRPVISDILLVAVVFWLIIVAFRRLRRLERRSAVFLIELFVLCLLLLMMAAVQLSFSIGWISPSMSQIVQSLGTMFILPLFALIMFDLLTDPLMLLARLVGVVLVVTLFLVGGISWLLALPFLNISLNAVSSTANAPLWRLPMDAQGMIEMTQVLVYPETFQWLKPGAGPALSPDITAQAQADYLAVRRMLHTPMLLLTLAAAFTTVWVIAAVPLLLRWSLFSPLEALLAGVRQVNAGRLDVDVPVHLHDELGQVTEAFNRMVAELRDMVATLEARVAERTAELSRSEERFRGLVEQIDEIIFRVALPDAHLEYISPALERMLGYDVEWAMNNPEFISDVLHPDYVGWYHERLAELAEGKVAPQYEYQVLDSEGRPRWLQQSNVDIVDSDGRLIAIECVSRDVTVNKLAEAQLRMQQSELAALHERERIGRDLHDGLGQVMGYVNVQAQAARSLVEAGQVAQAEAIMAQLAQVAKDAHADIRRYILDLRLPAAEVVTQEWRTALSNYLQTFEQNYGINVHLSYPAGLSPDPFPPAAGKEVFQIIQEALNNVRKHAGVKTAQVILLQADDHITVIVADNGAGFEVGKAGEAASTEARERNFGLKIMCERAEVIGASLQINSAPDAGTQVMVRVPLTRDEAEQPVELSLDEMAVIGLRVLLVDDHPLFLEGMRNICPFA